MSRFRLLADDLTGALDSAAGFVPTFGPIPVLWSPWAGADVAALDSNTREANPRDADAALPRFARELAGADLAFKKLDSQLRGHPAVEIALCLREGNFEHAVIAPAFPFQGRTTSGGRQIVDGRDIGADLAATLAAFGETVRLCRPGDPAPGGISLWDAGADQDLDTVVAAGRSLPGRVLWCGSGGFASALGGRLPVPCPSVPRPVLALIGTDHPTTRLQLDACAHRHRLADTAAEAVMIGAQLTAGISIAVNPVLPDGLTRIAAAQRIASRFAALVRRLPRPGALAVSGGETLRNLCAALGTDRLDVDGELTPGVPTSRLVGGAWDGLRVVSKSGGFGHPGFLGALLDD
jgi:uncharacterized protein YgbK (DUF1537 family)